MVRGIDLFFSLFNNLAIFIALVTLYGYLLRKFKKSIWLRRQSILGISFGLFAIGCMYAKIPVFEGVIVDQRNAIIALSGAFGGPLPAIISAACAGIYRVYLGGGGAFAGVVGVSLAAVAGIILNRFPGCFASTHKAAVSSVFATIVILPGFLFVQDFQTGWILLKSMSLPYGFAIFCGILSVGLLLNREQERIAFEQSFKESEEKYRELIEGTQDLITHTDENGNFTFANHVSEKILGILPQDCLGKSAFDFIHPKDREKTITWFKDGAIKKEKTKKIENRLINTKTGESRVIMWSSSFHYNDAGSLIGVGSIARDITEQKLAETERKKLEAQLSTALDMAGLGHWEYEVAEDRFIFNDHFYKIFGTTAKKIGGYTMSSHDYANRFVHPDDRDLVGREIKRAIEETNPTKKHQVEHRIIYADGSFGFISVQFFVVKDKDGKTVKTYGVNQDITERKKTEKKLQQAQRVESIGNLAGGIAHDFNNILFPIVGLSEMLLDDLAEGSSEHENAREIFNAGKRGSDLVRQILAFSRQSEHKMFPVQLQKIIEEVIQLCRSTIPKNIEIKHEINSSCGKILADPTQLHQIIMNLITNSYHAIEPNNGEISITLKQININQNANPKVHLESGQYVLLTVSDSGSGIAPHLIEKIFDPYFTTKVKGKGTGLGLAVVYGIVKEHHGEIEILSELNKGTTVNVYFPLFVDSTEQIFKKEAQINPGRNERILVVDDEESIATMVKQMLERLGYQVSIRLNSIEALNAFKSQPEKFDLVISDMTMPHMTGDILSKEILFIRPDMPIIICTGFSEQINKDQANLMGIKGFLMKPVLKSDLSSMVRKVLDNYFKL